MRIVYWTADQSGCAYYRCRLPGEQLRTLGHDVTWGQHLHPDARHGVDVLVGQRISEPGPSRLWRSLAAEGRSKMVFELDDDFWSVDPANKPAHQYYTPAVLDQFTENIRVADLVTVSTVALADVVSRWNGNVEVLSNCIPARLLDQPGPEPDPETVTIGYAASPSHARDFGEVAKPLKRVLQKHGGAAEFHCLGSDFTDRVVSIKGRTRHTPWVPDVDTYLDTVDFDIGIAPLHDNVFNASKSHIKALEYAAMGIPVIASPVGPYAQAVRGDSAPLLLAHDPRHWNQLLDDLVRNSDLRKDYRTRGRAWAAMYAIEDNAQLWEKVYSR